MATMPAHARLPPSASKRWMKCPGSVRMSMDRVSESSSYARLGTAAHSLFEMCMRLDDDPDRWIGRTIEAHLVDEDMANAVGHACDYVRSYLARFPTALWYPERIVDIGMLFNRDDLWGTSDTVLDNRAERELIVLDYKHGAGIYVGVEDNEQLMSYALGHVADFLCAVEQTPFDHPLPWDKILLVIVQPRITGTEPVRTWELSVAALMAFAKELQQAAARTDAPDAPLVAGAHCRFCPAAAVCPALAQLALTTACGEFVDLDKHPRIQPVAPHTLDLDDLAYALKMVPLVRGWCNSVEETATDHMLRGGTLEGHKVVRGRNANVWSLPEPEMLSKFLGMGFAADQVAPRVLASTAAVRRLVTAPAFKEHIEQYVRMVPGKLTIAPEHDRRTAVPVVSEFTNLDEPDPLLD